MLILERPWTSQPQRAVALDPYWTSQGLVSVINPAAPGPNLARVGAPTYVSTPSGIALKNPNDTTVNGLTHSPIAFGSAATIVGFCTVANDAAASYTSLALGTTGAGNQGFAIQGRQTGVVDVRAFVRTVNGGGFSSVEVSGYSSAWTTTPSVWAAVYDGTSTLTIYRNGVDVSATRANTAASGTIAAIDNFSLGLVNRGADGSSGPNTLNLLGAAFNRALTPAQVRELSDHIWSVYAPRRIFIPGAVVGGGVTGTVAVTTGADTSSASGTTTVVGSLAGTTAADTSVASGTVTIVGTLAATTGADTSVASGTAGSDVSGSLAVTTGADTSAASGTTTVVGTLARTTASDTVSASGVSGSVTGTLAVTSGSDTGYAYDVLPATVRKLENWYYRPALVPFSAEAWLVRELNTISRSTYGAAPFVQMVDVTVEPDKPNPGMVVFTTATAWDPGSGAGVYCYRSGAWHLLG